MLAGLACLSTLASLLAFVWRFGLDELRAPDLTIGFGGMFILELLQYLLQGGVPSGGDTDHPRLGALPEVERAQAGSTTARPPGGSSA